MSEVQRFYTPPAGRGRRYGATRRRGCGPLVWLLLLVGVPIAALWWLSRDSYPMASLLPPGQRYEVFANDVLNRRSKVAESRIWGAAAAFPGLAAIPGTLTQDLDVPEWVLNNLAPHACYLSGDDVRNFGDVLFVTKMTRIGCLLARAHRYFPGTRSDSAGGIMLRYLADPGIYYAVRGRLLLVSRSRDVLIRAITLRPEDSLAGKGEASVLEGAGAEDLRGTIALTPENPMGHVLSDFGFALRINPDAAVLKCRAVLRPEWQLNLDGLLDGLAPQTLRVPPEGMLRVSLDVRKPPAELWSAIAEAAGKPEWGGGVWPQVSAAIETPCPGLAEFAAKLFAETGTGIRLSWRGVDLNEIMPMPEVVATFDASSASIRGVFDAINPPPEGVQPWVCYPRYDPERGQVRVTTVSGPSMELTAAPYGESLLLSTSSSVAETVLEEKTASRDLPEPGNIYVQVRPGECVKAVVSVAELLIENDLLRDIDLGKLEVVAEPWLTGAAAIEEVSVLVAYENGEAAADVNVICTR